MRKISNGWILKMINYGKSPLKEPYSEFREEIYFRYLEEAIVWLKNMEPQ